MFQGFLSDVVSFPTLLGRLIFFVLFSAEKNCNVAIETKINNERFILVQTERNGDLKAGRSLSPLPYHFVYQ